MIGKLARLGSLSWPERRVLLQAVLLLPLFAVGIRMLGLARLRAWVVCAPATSPVSRAAVEPARMGALINSAGANLPAPATCLTRSLLLDWMLRRRGVHSELRIGVRMTGGAFDAHAWVECDGRPVNDAPDVAQRFAAFDGPLPARSFPAP